MVPLNLSHYTRVQAEICIASSVGNGRNLRLSAVVDGNAASYKVTDGNRVLFEGASSFEAATAFNDAMAGRSRASAPAPSQG